MQPYFFPYLGYFQLINSVDKFLLYDDVNFIKKGWINRNFILLNGEKHLITVPLVNPSQNVLICETLIFQEPKWKEKSLSTISQAYKKSPFFSEVFPLLENIFMNNFQKISDFNKYSLQKICNYLNIETIIEETSNRNYFNNLKGEDRIIAICKAEKGNQYINPSGGVELYQKEKFDENGIELKFLKPNIFFYPQFRNEPVPNLSIIDVLMFVKREFLINQLNKFELF